MGNTVLTIVIYIPHSFSMEFLCGPNCFHYRDNADDFIAAHRLSDMLVKINLEESASQNAGSMLGLPPAQMGSVNGWPTEHGTGKCLCTCQAFKVCTVPILPSFRISHPIIYWKTFQSWLHLILRYEHIFVPSDIERRNHFAY